MLTRYPAIMRVVIDLPDAVAAILGGSPEVLSAAARDALLAEAYRAGRLTAADLQDALNLPTVDAFDGFLKAHGVPLEYTEADVAREGALIAQLWPRPVPAGQP